MKRPALLLLALVLPEATAWGACGHLDHGQVLRGRFVQTRQLQGFAHPLVTEGRFVLAPERGLIWRTETPFAVTTTMSPVGLVQEMHGSETLRLLAERAPFFSRLYAMLSGALAGNWSALESDFTLTRAGDATAWQATLKPRAEPFVMMPFQSIVAHGGCLVEEVDLVKPSGDSERLRFLDQTVSTGSLTAEEEAALVR